MMNIVKKINKIAPIINLFASLFAGFTALWCASRGDWYWASINVGLSVLNFSIFLFNRRIS